MKSRIASIMIVAVLAAPIVGLAANGNYKVDTAHSAVIFRIQHVGVSYTYGRFNDITGSVAFDPANPGAASFDITVKAASVDTANAKRDEHLRGPDFFNVKQFPDITFKSSSVEKISNDKLRVTGKLSLHGVTRTVTTEIDIIGHGSKGPFGTRAGFETTIQLNRSDYNMTYGIDNGSVGDEVTLRIALEVVKQ